MRALKTIFFSLILYCVVACQNNSHPKEKPIAKSHLIKAKGNRYYGGTFKFNQISGFRSLEPHEITDLTAVRIGNQIFEGLLKYDTKNLKTLPALAKSWELDKSGKQYTFHLRTDAYFHENICFGPTKTRRVNAYDVAYCLTRVCQPRLSNSYFYLFTDIIEGASEYYHQFKNEGTISKEIKGIQVLNDSTLKLTITSPSMDFLKILGTPGGWVFPQEAIEYYKENIENNLVGTGPFVLDSFKPDSLLTLKRNPNYWDHDDFGNRKPFVNQIKITFNPNKRDEIIAFRNGKLCMVWEIPVHLINDMMGNIDDAKQGKNMPYKIKSNSLTETYYYGFNHQIKPFDNKLVRQAFSLAIDKEKLVIFYLNGEGISANYGFVPPTLPHYPFHQVKGTKYNPERAKKLLKKAGYGRKNKFPQITLQYDISEKNEIVAKGVKKMLKDNLGIDINLKALPYKQHYKSLEKGTVQFFRASWIADYPSPNNFLVQFYSNFGKSNPIKTYSPNMTRYKNLAYDSLYTSCLEQKDINEQSHCFAQADQFLMDDAAVIPIIYGERINLLNLEVQNLETNNLGIWDFSEVYMKPFNPNAKNPLLESKKN